MPCAPIIQRPAAAAFGATAVRHDSTNIPETVFASLEDKSKLSDGTQTAVNLESGLIAGFAAAIVSQPADTVLSKINKTKVLPGQSTVSRLIKIAGELGVRGSFAGLPTRLFMIGGLTTGQFAIYGDIKKALGKCTLLVS